MNFLPTPQKTTQELSKEEAQFQLLQNEQDFTDTKQDSNICQIYPNLEPTEVDIGSKPSDIRPSVWQTGSLNAATSKENIAGSIGEIANVMLTEASCSLEQAGQTESSHKNVDPELCINFGGLPEDHVSLQPLDTCCDLLVDSNTYNCTEMAASPTGNEADVRNKFLASESEPTGLHTNGAANENFKTFEENFAAFSNQQLPEQGSGVAVVVSMDLDGWQRFDSEGNEGNVAFGCDQAMDRKLLKKGELWEQLLEVGSEDDETQHKTPISQVDTETGVDNTLYGGNQFWSASPGNPFIEGLDRISNFSEADHCNASEFVSKSQLPECFEANIASPFKESSFHTNHINKNCPQEDKVDEVKGSLSNGLYNHGGNRPAKPRFPSFSDLRRPSSGSKDSSFASILDQVSAFQAGNHVQGLENGYGEKWEANFDTMVPPTQEGLRSLSLPREAGTPQGQRRKQSFRFFSREAPDRSQPKPSGISSLKQSSVVKKALNKVRTKPAGEVDDAVCNGKSSVSMDTEPKKRIWRCCICCTHAS